MELSRKTVLIVASEKEAERASAVLGDVSGWDEFPLVLSEQPGHWALDCYDDGALAEEAARVESVLKEAGIALLAPPAAEALPQADWVSETQKALPPVRAGRFLIHGSHDRSAVHSHWAIEIDAGRAFGTAHHGTTRGCLAAIDRIVPTLAPRSALDLGTGSAVLAIAAVKAAHYRCRVAAVDIDPVAIAVARENCLKNGVAGHISLYTGDGAKPALAYADQPFDLILANILARPLLTLSQRLHSLLRVGGVVILSGLLSEQAREVAARYRGVGFCLVEKRELEGWATLVLRRTT